MESLSAAGPRGRAEALRLCPDEVGEPDRGALEHGSALIRTARAFAMRAHARQSRDSDGLPFIEHPLEVACLLRGAGCSDVVVAAGLLHDVLENTEVSHHELTARFGADVAALVRAVSDDAGVRGYRERKRRLREHVRRTGGDAAVLFAADKISKVGELDAGYPADTSGRAIGRDGTRRERRRRLQIEHYEASLEMLRGVASQHPLVQRLADVLAERRSCTPAAPPARMVTAGG